jgi:hypothetical protein
MSEPTTLAEIQPQQINLTKNGRIGIVFMFKNTRDVFIFKNNYVT